MNCSDPNTCRYVRIIRHARHRSYIVQTRSGKVLTRAVKIFMKTFTFPSVKRKCMKFYKRLRQTMETDNSSNVAASYTSDSTACPSVRLDQEKVVEPMQEGIPPSSFALEPQLDQLSSFMEDTDTLKNCVETQGLPDGVDGFHAMPLFFKICRWSCIRHRYLNEHCAYAVAVFCHRAVGFSLVFQIFSSSERFHDASSFRVQR